MTETLPNQFESVIDKMILDGLDEEKVGVVEKVIFCEKCYLNNLKKIQMGKSP